jgi:high affinity cAMP-specific 3',5'-cyclic phosphodiesterase 7
MSYLLPSESNPWQWDAFAFDVACGGQPLLFLSVHLLQKSGLVDQFQLDVCKMCKWLKVIEENYGDNPYHNNIHAADVLQVCSK